MDTTVESTTPDRLRAELAATLMAKNWIRTTAVERAFWTVPRHLFVPDTVTPEQAYEDTIVATKRGPDGKTTSSVSAPWLQSFMLEEAGLNPGARVLEIGSGGYQAALIAELVGPNGLVVTVDIDAEVTGLARTYLDRAGYPQVQVVHGDGDLGHPPGAPYDAIIITMEVGDVSPFWVDQLTPDGRIILPLRMRTLTRCLTLHRRDDHLAASRFLQCGFVPMQGERSQLARRIPLRGNDIVLLLDDPVDVDSNALTAALDGPRVDVWSPVTITMQELESFESLHLWLSSQPWPFGALAVDRQRTEGLVDPQDRFTCPTLLTAGSLAYLTMRKIDDDRWQFGAHGFGPDAHTLTADLLDAIAAWDSDYRHARAPEITVHPDGTTPPAATAQPQLVVARRHTAIAVTWPPAESSR
ncbi:methyltransferase, FxLD system [Actinoplanes sp. ATCC 53533]|uniref:methyltransferase, FxLD system n=1 Tax=Actinoplanes sp. ATCC 53533 TaxID=1288362 RepID=UPI001F002361|nr:methyltransferase, FxLD system [Actinoplanes sp. ATCC 53533]